ncbi:hypothetical protein NDU88_000229 [Pleurodeles waltl]|uniref:Uncharacterized protein n=1 Tax=Pleurodeles waltl TaxID=8319 RepID=A0AAV7KME4_PLEWA|nr:hypothetical protein NDU88_000229 [Pleurodeles waltl]
MPVRSQATKEEYKRHYGEKGAPPVDPSPREHMRRRRRTDTGISNNMHPANQPHLEERLSTQGRNICKSSIPKGTQLTNKPRALKLHTRQNNTELLTHQKNGAKHRTPYQSRQHTKQQKSTEGKNTKRKGHQMTPEGRERIIMHPRPGGRQHDPLIQKIT